MPDTLSGLFISEILADNPGSGFDTDGDGRTNKADEYVEIQNATGSTISLDGFEIWSSKNGFLYSFSAGDTVAAGDTATVVGNYNGTEPAGFYDAGLNENGNFLQDGEGNKNDTIFLVDTNTGEYIAVSYGTNPSQLPTPPGFPGTTQVGTGETITSSAPNGVAFIRDTDGTLIEGPPSPGNPGPVCYGTGTLIETSDGPRRIETLADGDRVLTRDAGFKPVLWHHHQQQDLSGLPTDKHPVVIEAGALGPGRPRRRLTVSPQHRVLVGGGQLDTIFQGEALVPAKALTGLPGISHDTKVKTVQWHHLALDAHHVILAEGCLAETILPGAMALQSLSRLQARVLARHSGPPEPARPLLKVQEARRIIAAFKATSRATEAA